VGLVKNSKTSLSEERTAFYSIISNLDVFQEENNNIGKVLSNCINLRFSKKITENPMHFEGLKSKLIIWLSGNSVELENRYLKKQILENIRLYYLTNVYRKIYNWDLCIEKQNVLSNQFSWAINKLNSKINVNPPKNCLIGENYLKNLSKIINIFNSDTNNWMCGDKELNSPKSPIKVKFKKTFRKYFS
jgi:hypothetical protein